MHFSVRRKGSMLLTKAFARRILAISPLVAGAAFLALAAFTPSIASATSLTIYHDSAPPSAGTDPSVNPFNSSHTVVGQLSGVCIASGDVEDGDEGGSCLSDSDCQPDIFGGNDEVCDFSGVTGVGVAFRITGTNAHDIDFSPTNGSGQVSINYPDANGPGTDTIQGCADLGDGGIDDDVSACLTDDEPDEDI